MTAGDADRIACTRELYAAFTRGDLASVIERLSPDVEWCEPDHPSNPCGGRWRGHAGFAEWARIGRGAEEILSLVPRTFLANGDTVAVIGHTRCRVRSTGKIYATDFVHVIVFDGSQVAMFQEYFDTYTAGEAFRF